MDGIHKEAESYILKYRKKEYIRIPARYLKSKILVQCELLLTILLKIIKNNLIKILRKTFAIHFHSKRIRVPLRPQITFENIKITNQSELRFPGVYNIENLKWGAHVRLLSAKLYKISKCVSVSLFL
jgi:hypothetical protein